MAEHVQNKLLKCEHEGCDRDLRGKQALSRHMNACTFRKVEDDEGEQEWSECEHEGCTEQSRGREAQLKHMNGCRFRREEQDGDHAAAAAVAAAVGEAAISEGGENLRPGKNTDGEKPGGADTQGDAPTPSLKKGVWSNKNNPESPLIKKLNAEGNGIPHTGPRKLLIPDTNVDESLVTEEEEEDGDQAAAAAVAVVETAQGIKELPPSLHGTMPKRNPFALSQMVAMAPVKEDTLGEDASQAEFRKFMVEQMGTLASNMTEMTDNMTEMATKRDLMDYAGKIEKVGMEAREALDVANTAAGRYDRLEDLAELLEERLVRVERTARGGMNDSYITVAQASANAQEVAMEMKRKEKNIVVKGVREQEEEDPQTLHENVAVWLAEKMRPVYSDSYKDKLEGIMWDQIESAKRQGPFNAFRKFPREVVVTFFHKNTQEKILKDFIPIRNDRIKAWEEYKSLPREERNKRDPPSFFDIAEDHPNYLRNRGNEIKDIAKVAACHRTLKKPGKIGAVQLPRGDFRLALLEAKRGGFAEIQSAEDTVEEVREILIKAGEARGWDLKGSRAATKLGEHMPRVMPQELRGHRPLIAPARDVERWRSGNGVPQGPQEPPQEPQEPTRRTHPQQEPSRRTPQQQEMIKEVQDKLLEINGALGVGDADKLSQKNM